MSDEPETTPIDGDNSGLIAFARSSFEGPLPPPEMLGVYEAVSPGAAERIISMAEDQQRHRMSVEQDRSETVLEIARSREHVALIGQYTSLVVVAASAIVAIITAITDPSWVIGPIGSPALIWTAAWA